MSDLYKEAIIEAKALREAAEKTVLESVVQKFSPQIKERVERLLEADEDFPLEDDFGSDMDDPMGGMGDDMPPDVGAEMEAMPGEPDDFVSNMPMGALGGEDACPCPEDDEQIELDFDELMTMSDDFSSDGMMDSAELVEELPDDDEMIREADLMRLAEEFEVDSRPAKTGWSNQAYDDAAYAQEQTDAVENSDTSIEDPPLTGEKRPFADRLQTTSDETLREGVEQLMKTFEKLVNEVKTLKNKQKGYIATISNLKMLVESTNLQNAKLLFSNRALENPSLNERQKTQIVEEVRKCDSVEQVKGRYDFVLNAVKETKRKPTPNSLTEVLNRRKSFRTLKPHQNNDNQEDERIDEEKLRLQKLAGIITE